jgi:hypothetical protein
MAWAGEMEVGMRIWRVATALAVVSMLAGPGVAHATSLYDSGGVCINPPPSTWAAAPSSSSDQFTVTAPPGYAKAAIAARDVIRSKGFFGYYEAHLKIARLGLTGQPQPVQLFIDPDLRQAIPGAGGVTEPFCGNTGAIAIALYPDTSDPDQFGASIAHELFHAAQAALGGNFGNNWWYEATANFAAEQFGYQAPGKVSGEVTDFPQFPMDTFKSGPTDGLPLHQYGAWTFVSWLYARGKLTWDMLRKSFIDAAHTDATPVVDDLLKSKGTDLGTEVASYWGDHLNNKPRFGQTAQMQTVTIASESAEPDFPLAKPLAAKILSIRPDSSRKQLVLIIKKLQPGVRVSIRTDEKQLWELQPGESFNETFCRAGLTPGSLPLPKTGDVRVAITTTDKTAQGDVHMKTITSSDPCPKLLLVQPGLAVGPLHIGMTLAEAAQATLGHGGFVGPRQTPFGVFQSTTYKEGKGAYVVTDFLNGRVALMLTIGPRFITTTGIRAFTINNIHTDSPEFGPAIIPGSTLSDFGGTTCRDFSGGNPPDRICARKGPSNRWTFVAASQIDPCPTDSPDDDHDIDVPPCDYPKDWYVHSIGVTTNKAKTILEAELQ